MFTLIIGLPNAGKTTYSSKYENVYHGDELRLEEIDKLTETDEDICIEGIFIVSRQRRKLCEKYNGKGKRCIWLDTPLEVCIKRENRGRNGQMLKNCHRFFEPPTKEEGWDEIIRINYDESSSN